MEFTSSVCEVCCPDGLKAGDAIYLCEHDVMAKKVKVKSGVHAVLDDMEKAVFGKTLSDS